MKWEYFLACMLVPLFCRAEVTTTSDDPLLDARLRVEAYRLRYTEQHPKMIMAEEELKMISGTFRESPAVYESHLQERIQEVDAERAKFSARYSDKHPKMIMIDEELLLLNDELKRVKLSDAI
jgi:hypothetical protein